MKAHQALQAVLVHRTNNALEKQAGGLWNAAKAFGNPLINLLKNRALVTKGEKAVAGWENAAKNMPSVTAKGKAIPGNELQLGDVGGSLAHDATKVYKKGPGKIGPSAAPSSTGYAAEAAKLKAPGSELETALKDYALGKRNLGIAGVGGAGLLGSNMLSHHLGYGSGNTEGFNRGGEAGWAGGQQQGMEAARKAYGDSGFLSRLMSSFSPGDPGAMQGAQYQAYNPQVSQALKEISKAMQASNQKAESITRRSVT